MSNRTSLNFAHHLISNATTTRCYRAPRTMGLAKAMLSIRELILTRMLTMVSRMWGPWELPHWEIASPMAMELCRSPPLTARCRPKLYILLDPAASLCSVRYSFSGFIFVRVPDNYHVSFLSSQNSFQVLNPTNAMFAPGIPLRSPSSRPFGRLVSPIAS